MLIDYKEGEKPQVEGKAKLRSAIDALGSKLRSRFDEWAQARRNIEDDWIRDLRAFNAQYDSDTQARLDADPNRSQIYVRLTREKTMAAYSRVIDLLFPGTDSPWGIVSTPVPEFIDEPTLLELNQQAMGEVQQIMEEVQAQGGELGADPRQIAKDRVKEIMGQRHAEATREAKDCAKLMEDEILDQLSELNYESLYKQAIMESCMLGTGAVKGATMKFEQKTRWVEGDGAWGVEITDVPRPNVKYISIFNIYPDPYSTNLSDLGGVFERHIMTKTQFRELKDMPGFNGEQVERIIANNPDGNHVEQQHERDRRVIAGNSISLTSNRFEVVEYWGLVDGQDLITAGLNVSDPSMEYEANIWFVDSEVVCARLNPHKGVRVPYHLFPYERTPHQLWGIGVPKMMRDSQDTINAAVRIFIDNQAISSGPQVEVNTSMLPQGADVQDIHPWKIWLREGGDAATPMLRFYQPQNVSAHLTQVIELFRRFADEETSLPSYTHGQHTPGMTKTASGMSMLMGAASVAIKSVIKNIDDYLTKPLITNMYFWNMRWNEKEHIKGDMKVLARGSTTLLAKEVQSQRLMQFAQMTANEVDLQHTDRREILKEVALSLELDPDKLMPLMDEMVKQEMEQQQAALQAKEDTIFDLEQRLREAELGKTEAQTKREQAMAARHLIDAQTLPVEREAEAARDFAYAGQTRQEILDGKVPQGWSQ